VAITSSPLDGWQITFGISALVLLVLYRRARRLFGRQRYSVPRLSVRIGLVGLLGGLLIIGASVVRGLGPWVGLSVGVSIGLVGIALTRFEFIDGELFFKPNALVGAGVLSLLIGRMVYRLTVIGSIAKSFSSNGSDPSAIPGLPGSSLTTFIVFIVLGFYVSYYLGVLIRGQIARQ
jgi:hypothetical protein